MLKISLKPHWRLGGQAQDESLRSLLELLRAIHEEQSLTGAVKRLKMSYRHAWGMVRKANRDFGAPLLDMRRGRRAKLSELGEKLVAADRRTQARLTPLLASLASELEAEIERSRRGAASVLRVQASHGYAIELLREFLARRDVAVDLKYRGSMESLAALAGDLCELAGFHVASGALQEAMLSFYAKWLQPERQRLIGLCTRRQGIMVAAGNPMSIQSLADLSQPGVRFVNRQFGSGTRILLDLLLGRERLDSRCIAGYDTGEFTHSGVAACVASGIADAGFGVETAAREFGLDFIPVASERYFLICTREALDTPAIRRILDIVRSKQYRAEAGKFAGIDVTEAGKVLELAEAFPELEIKAASRERAR